MNGMNEKGRQETCHEPAWEVPVLAEYDVVVCGGGMAGFGAACAAARHGARTLIVERQEVLGGLGSSGCVGNFSYGDDTLPLAHGKVFDDIWDGLSALKAIGPENGWLTHVSELYHNHTFDHAALPIVLLDIALKDGVELLFATDVVGARITNGRLTEAVIHNRSLLQSVRAKVFVDGTGDGILSRHAGGRALPDDPDHPGVIPPSHMILVHKAEERCGEPVAAPSAAALKYSVWPEPNRVGLKMWMPDRTFDTATGVGYSQATIEFRRRIPEFVRHFQTTARGKGYVFDHSAPMLGLRDSCRVEGEYVLEASDLRAGRRFDDSVGFGCYCFDSSRLRKEKIPPYQIPYRSLIVKGIANLLVVGRCFSSTRVALSSARVMPSCCLMGQGAGIAAALSVSKNIPIREVPADAVRTELLDAARGKDLMRERLCP